MGEAYRRACRNEGFWRMVFANGGVSFTELRRMDAWDYQEACAARILWQEEWNSRN